MHDFLKRTSIGYATADGFRRVREHAERFARWEGFEAHARAVSERESGEEDK
ncbi:MAG: histidinol dehydrogenase [Firmicutes bacterium]|nr:histidinol dehydrogenase [Bacillota bacterium]